MSEFVFFEMRSPTAEALNLKSLPYPVRSDRAGEVFGREQVDMGRLLQDLELFLRENPQLRPHYLDNLGRLAYLAGMGAVRKGSQVAALHYFESGLLAVPGNLSLRANYALTLHRLGRETEALSQYETVLADPDSLAMPLVSLLAARIYAKQGQFARALALLEACAPQFPGDDRLQEYLKEIRAKAGIPAQAAAGISIPSKEQAPATPQTTAPAPPAPASGTPPPTCTQCGNPLKPGIKFCGLCATPVRPTPAASQFPPDSPATCARCGMALTPNAEFCGHCGASPRVIPKASPIPPAPVMCAHCGEALASGVRFCRHCGTPAGRVGN